MATRIAHSPVGLHRPSRQCFPSSLRLSNRTSIFSLVSQKNKSLLLRSVACQSNPNTIESSSSLSSGKEETEPGSVDDRTSQPDVTTENAEVTEFSNKSFNRRVALASNLGAVGLFMSGRLDFRVSVKDIAMAAVPYEKDLSNGMPTILEFYADRCEVCRELAPDVYKVEEKYSRKVLLHELEVAAPADEVWAVYRSHDLPRLIAELLPSVFESITVVKGDGGVGTVMKLVFPGDSIPKTYKEKIVTMDNAKRLKEVLQLSEGYLELGASYYMDSFEIIDKGPNVCIIRSKTEYEIDPNRQDNATQYISIKGLTAMAIAISAYVMKIRLNRSPQNVSLQSAFNKKHRLFADVPGTRKNLINSANISIL